jgi:glutamyl-tRNA synthetase
VRSSEDFTVDILNGLRWLGLGWDEGPDIGGPFPPYRQTEKVDHYQDIANKLIANGSAYFCYCTVEELNRLKEDQRAEGRGPQYDNRCRNLAPEKHTQYEAEGRIPYIRFKIDEPRVVSWNDGIKGVISIDSSDLGGDMVIVKSNGIAIYNFAVVVDDIDMKISEVIRGEDHIHNTAKQILIYEALEQPVPEFAHVPLIFDLEKRKLSKRHHGEAVHIDRYRKDGYLPEAMVNYLAQMSWTPADGKEIFTLEEGCKMFDLGKVSKSPAIFDIQRLKWFNGNYIRALPLEIVTDRCLPYFEEFDTKQYSREQLEEIVGSVREGLAVLSEITAAARFYFETVEVPQDLQDTLLCKDTSKQSLSAFLQKLGDVPWGDRVGCKAVVDAIGKELGIKGKDLYWPLRAALSGNVHGPDLGSIISILGETRVRQRLESALQLCHSR